MCRCPNFHCSRKISFNQFLRLLGAFAHPTATYVTAFCTTDDCTDRGMARFLRDSRASCSLASTPPGMPGTHPPQYFGWGDVNGNIPPILLRTFGYSRPLLVALRSLSLKPISFGCKTPPIRFSQAGGQSAHEARPPNFELALTPLVLLAFFCKS